MHEERDEERERESERAGRRMAKSRAREGAAMGKERDWDGEERRGERNDRGREREREREEERGVYASHRPRRVASLKARAMGARRLERRQSVLNCLSMRQPLRARLKPGSRWT